SPDATLSTWVASCASLPEELMSRAASPSIAGEVSPASGASAPLPPHADAASSSENAANRAAPEILHIVAVLAVTTRRPRGSEKRTGERNRKARRHEAQILRAFPFSSLRLVVVLGAEVRDQLFAAQVAERVLQLHELDEQVVLRVQAGRGLRAL